MRLPGGALLRKRLHFSLLNLMLALPKTKVRSGVVHDKTLRCLFTFVHELFEHVHILQLQLGRRQLFLLNFEEHLANVVSENFNAENGI